MTTFLSRALVPAQSNRAVAAGHGTLMRGGITAPNRMADHRDKRSRRATVAIAASALVACLLLPGSASAGPDELEGGTVTLQLSGSSELKLRPRAVSLPITGGLVDPVDGSGSVEVAGGFRAKRGGRKAKVSVTGLTFGAGGGPGRLGARVGKKKLGAFGALSGGTVTRAGFGASLTGITLKLTRKGAKTLNLALGTGRGKGRRAASARIRAGQPIGTVSATTIPNTVEVVPGSGTMELATSLAPGSLGAKLAAHCIDAITPILVPPGVAAVPPATFEFRTFTFPVTGGFVAPDFSDGRLITGGGQTLTKNNGPLTPGLGGPPCSTSEPPVGSQILSTEFEAQFAINALAANTTTPTGALGIAALGPIDFSTGTRSIDPATCDLSVDGATVVLDVLTAFVLNQVFPNQSGNPDNDFAGGDLVGTLATAAKLR